MFPEKSAKNRGTNTESSSSNMKMTTQINPTTFNSITNSVPQDHSKEIARGRFTDIILKPIRWIFGSNLDTGDNVNTDRISLRSERSSASKRDIRLAGPIENLHYNGQNQDGDILRPRKRIRLMSDGAQSEPTRQKISFAEHHFKSCPQLINKYTDEARRNSSQELENVRDDDIMENANHQIDDNFDTPLPNLEIVPITPLPNLEVVTITPLLNLEVVPVIPLHNLEVVPITPPSLEVVPITPPNLEVVPITPPNFEVVPMNHIVEILQELQFNIPVEVQAAYRNNMNDFRPLARRYTLIEDSIILGMDTRTRENLRVVSRLLFRSIDAVLGRKRRLKKLSYESQRVLFEIVSRAPNECTYHVMLFTGSQIIKIIEMKRKNHFMLSRDAKNIGSLNMIASRIDSNLFC